LVRLQFLVFVLNFSFKAVQTQLIIRIFRVLHTVQSSVFKVLFCLLLQEQLIYNIMSGCFCQPFFSFSSIFSHRSSMCFRRSLPPFSTAKYIIPKHSTNVNAFLKKFSLIADSFLISFHGYSFRNHTSFSNLTIGSISSMTIPLKDKYTLGLPFW